MENQPISQTDTEPSGQTKKTPASDTPPPKATVLIIEDSKVVRMMTTTRLQKAGYRTLEAEDGPIGIAIARTEKPDLILLDLAMPHMSGQQVAEYMQDDEMLSSIPIMIVTTTGYHDIVIALMQLSNVHDYLIKPVERTELLQRIRKVLDKTATNS